MKLNCFQQAEVDSHNDAELGWVVQSTIELFKADKSNFTDGAFQRFALYRKVGSAVNDVIAEREGFNDESHKMNEREAADCLWESFKEQYPGDNKQVWKHWDDLIFPFIDNLIYKSLLRTRVPIVERVPLPMENYWPFGQDGGFCNPYKIKMMDDD